MVCPITQGDHKYATTRQMYLSLPSEMFMLKNRNDPELSEANFHSTLNHSKRLLKNIYQMILSYGNGAGNTVEENSSVFSLIRMHQLPSVLLTLLVGGQEGRPACKNIPLHHKVQKFTSGTGSPGWFREKGRKTVVVWCGDVSIILLIDEKIFIVNTPKNPQNDRLYACTSTKKKDR